MVKLMPVAATMPTTAAASRCLAKKSTRRGKVEAHRKAEHDGQHIREYVREKLTSGTDPLLASLNVKRRFKVKFHTRAIAIASPAAIVRCHVPPNRADW